MPAVDWGEDLNSIYQVSGVSLVSYVFIPFSPLYPLPRRPSVSRDAYCGFLGDEMVAFSGFHREELGWQEGGSRPPLLRALGFLFQNLLELLSLKCFRGFDP